ncbi:ABC transporter substrate-binding protein [Tropicibacter oceani]|uniref:ABC transporter substrate-binding protein n=1 Tax=Tropicibacter oceani TaxID=3058420 RepID=A0ABY8QHC4_9RHOB|nr:ABC transporter substrate-binding protein [Tropicibacter oceani]WGW03363.1 ABC transporter substrate-binding protein [Tropicibacter oceani]
MRPSRLMACVAALICAVTTHAGAQSPRRVVSLNLCTDQLALMLADPGQIASLSALASDPRSSAMADQARGFPANDGSAESVVLAQPDLVLAGTWTTRATVDMLTRLGLRVEIFAPVNTLDEARANITRMGALLGQETRAQTILDQFDQRLTRLRATPGPSPRVALYYELGSTAGRDTLPGDILDAAGMTNIAAEKGLAFGGALPLEDLVLTNPDLILIGRPYGGHARATELLTHPVLTASGKLRLIEDGASWVCETPHLLDAIAQMIALRQDWSAAQ